MLILSRKPATVAFNMRPRRGPFGGGNQWLRQVSTYLGRCGYGTRFDLGSGVDIVLGTHAGLSGGLSVSYADVLKAKEPNPRLLCVQRINDNDARKGTTGMDAHLAECNRAADHTVFVSRWLRDYHASRWFDASRPHSVILNGADPAIFHPLGTRAWKPGETLRICTHHWSDNPAKGFQLYQELDALIASGRLRDVELWVIGRWPSDIRWKSARSFPPCAGHSLAKLLRSCHACITGSKNEPGAMHPVEALACGLPLLYTADTGGTVELGEQFGVLIGPEGLEGALDNLKSGYHELRHRVLGEAPSGDQMVLSYRRLVQTLIGSRS
jgi:glycosyltransferase involved in cell wall biosynthesis